MAELLDFYFLLNTREFSKIEGFINKVVPNKVECSEYYEVPQYSEHPLYIFNHVVDLMTFLEKSKSEEYNIYWDNLDLENGIKNIMLFYTDDKKAILGILIIGKFPINKCIATTFKSLYNLLFAEIGCITVEEPPPSNSVEFYKFCSDRFNTIKMLNF